MRFVLKVAAVLLVPISVILIVAACGKSPTQPDKAYVAKGGCPAGYICGSGNPYKGVVIPLGGVAGGLGGNGGSGGSSGGTVSHCAGTAPSQSCGTATGKCNNGDFTCSGDSSSACSSSGGLSCCYHPGPLCTD
jgi:hypothetical protein